PSPPRTVASSFSSTDPRRIQPIMIFSSPPIQNTTTIHVRTASILLLGLLLPVLTQAQSPIYFFEGENNSDHLGNSVSDAGDVNLDGFPDLVAGAESWHDPILGGTSYGRMYVYSG